MTAPNTAAPPAKPADRSLPVARPSFDRFGRRIDYRRIALTDRGNLRGVYKEFPILGPTSVVASRVAIAARQQGKYA